VCQKCELVQCHRRHLAPGRRMTRRARVGSGKCVRIGKERSGIIRERKRRASGTRHTTRKSAEKRGRRWKTARARTCCQPCEIGTDRQQESLGNWMFITHVKGTVIRMSEKRVCYFLFLVWTRVHSSISCNNNRAVGTTTSIARVQGVARERLPNGQPMSRASPGERQRRQVPTHPVRRDGTSMVSPRAGTMCGTLDGMET